MSNAATLESHFILVHKAENKCTLVTLFGEVLPRGMFVFVYREACSPFTSLLQWNEANVETT